MNIEERVKIAILTKYYGQLLTSRQLKVIKMYVDDNLSLQEVSVELGITRQAVKDTLDKALDALKRYEDQLSIIARIEKVKSLMDEKTLSEIDMSTRLNIISILEDE